MTKFSISPTDLNAALNSATPPRVFDVRKKPAFDAEPQLIPSAHWQVHDQVRDWSKDISTGASTNTSIVVYCVHGHEVSQNAAQHLRDLGFDARYLDGGFDEWKTAGFELVDAELRGAK